MLPTVLIGNKQEDAVRSLVNLASSLTFIHKNINNLSERGEARFELMQLELVKLAKDIGGKEAMQEVMQAVDISN